MQTVDLEREYLQEMIDLFQTRVSTELNRFVRKVTAWGTVGIAWTVIIGVYGMNIIGIPGLDSPWGFPAVIGSMVAVGGGTGAVLPSARLVMRRPAPPPATRSPSCGCRELCHVWVPRTVSRPLISARCGTRSR